MLDRGGHRCGGEHGLLCFRVQTGLRRSPCLAPLKHADRRSTDRDLAVAHRPTLLPRDHRTSMTRTMLINLRAELKGAAWVHLHPFQESMTVVPAAQSSGGRTTSTGHGAI